ncbi:uncharacterized protein [Apostichopus japonicus]|uniref:uncharacterized protein isoform X2 n=1 Tax=Stichopus japonicus TaxID=307972 RepID=UPI003AB63A25
MCKQHVQYFMSDGLPALTVPFLLSACSRYTRWDYTPTSTSLIGALQRNLSLSVRNLARDKEEDLRQLYSCWWSKPLPENIPYKKLLCFETKMMSQSPPQEMVGDAFRCLVPVLKNEDGSVITSLLNTGNQGYGKEVMLKGMVEAAVHWMKAGLPLRMLKIVLFCPRVEGDSRKVADKNGYKYTLETFSKLKEKYDMQYMMPKEVPVEYDFYLSYSETDTSIVEAIVEKLKTNKTDVRIFRKQQQLDKDAYWQEDMYEVMMKSSRVITVLSPNYMQSTACIEQYNIALCCNRNAHRDMLAPFYVITITNMPTYMGLVQYIDCRSNFAESVNSACYQIIISLSINFTRELSVMNASVIRYDLFLSYCHKETDLAQKMVKILQDLNPNLKIFFDVQELKTGKSWQRALYHSIDGSRCLVALMTNNYIKSAVCQEEFNLAMLKHYAKTNHLQLIPFVVEKIDYLPTGYEKVPQLTTDSDHFEEDAGKLCSSLVKWLETGKLEEDSLNSSVFQDFKDSKVEITEEWERLRRNQFEDNFQNSSATFPPPLTDAFKEEKKSGEDIDVVLSYNQHDKKYADFMIRLLRHSAPGLNVQAKGQTEQERLMKIEEGKKVVPLLSPNYIESPEQVEELHIAIWRARTLTNLIFPVHLHQLPPRPAYFHLLPCQVNLQDHLWSELALKQGVSLPADVYKVVKELVKPSEGLALYAAVYYLLETIKKDMAENLQPSKSPRPALLNIFHLDGASGERDDSEGNETNNSNNASSHANSAPSDIAETNLDESKGVSEVSSEEDKGQGEMKGQDEVNGHEEVKDEDEVVGQDDNGQDQGKDQEEIKTPSDEIGAQDGDRVVDKGSGSGQNETSDSKDVVEESSEQTTEGEKRSKMCHIF